MGTEAVLLAALLDAVGRERPAYLLPQVQVGARRIDAVLLVAGERIGVEVKTSRADFRRESDEKRAPTYAACHACLYLSPPGVIEPDDLPPGWGLWHVVDGRAVRRHPAERHEPTPEAVERLAVDLVERAAVLHRRVTEPGDVGALRAHIEALEGRLASRQDAVERERARAQDAADQVAAALGRQRCDACRQPIEYTRTSAWRHVERAVEHACRAARTDAERRRLEAMTGARYARVTPPRIIPALLSAPR